MPLFIEYPVNKDTLEMAGWTVVGNQALIELLGHTFQYHLKNKMIGFSDSVPEWNDWFYRAYFGNDPLGLVQAAHEEQGRILGLKPYKEWLQQFSSLLGYQLSTCNIFQDSKAAVVWSLGFSPVKAAAIKARDIKHYNYISGLTMFTGLFKNHPV